MSRPISLTSRLVATSVLLVAMVSVVIGAAAFAVIRTTLYRQLDASVLAATGNTRAPRPAPGGFEDHEDGPGTGIPGRGDFEGNVGQGTLLVWPELSYGYVTGIRRDQGAELSDAAIDALSGVPTDGHAHTIRVTGAGEYRVAVGTDLSGRVLIVGAPTHNANETLAGLLLAEVIAIVVALAGATGGGLLLVRRQLRPLREVAATANEVAELPLATGEIDLATRVPSHLTDERTEVGQVGSSLNRMLSHVESSLEARHRSEQQVRQFVADASHELRTPLATIAGYSELARQHPDDVAGLRTALDKVEAESGRMTALVADLLLLARLDAGRPLEQVPVDLTRILMESVADARVLAPDHQWRMELPDEAVEVIGDERALHQALTNLVTNARRYTPAGTTVTVSVGPVSTSAISAGAVSAGTASAGDPLAAPGLVRVAVHDNGPGFGEELAEHAFERFVRGDRARTRDGGTGLGLSLVKAITEAHHGEVFLDSRPGSTSIGFLLPGA